MTKEKAEENMSEKSCKEYADGAKRAAGWTFGHMFNFYFGNSTIVLVREGPNGTNIEFSATNEWLEVNHVTKFGIDKTMTQGFQAHIDSCDSNECVKAKKMLSAIHPFFVEGKLPGSEGIAIVSACEGKGYRDRTVLDRDNGFGLVIDEIHPFIKWFTGENRDFWIWPE